jgi:hypothetical protein
MCSQRFIDALCEPEGLGSTYGLAGKVHQPPLRMTVEGLDCAADVHDVEAGPGSFVCAATVPILRVMSPGLVGSSSRWRRGHTGRMSTMDARDRAAVQHELAPTCVEAW